MLLKNSGKADDKLIKAASPVAEHVEIHEHVMDGNAMRMRPVDGVPLPAGGMAELQPGGYHVMLIGLKHALKQGEHFPLTLTFEKAGRSEEHTSELQSLMRISYAVFCLKKKIQHQQKHREAINITYY